MAKRIKDSIALAKKIQNSKKALSKNQNYAVMFLGLSLTFAVGLAIVEFVYYSSLHPAFVFSIAVVVSKHLPNLLSCLYFKGFRAFRARCLWIHRYFLFWPAKAFNLPHMVRNSQHKQPYNIFFHNRGIISFLLMILAAALQLTIGINEDSRQDVLLHGLLGGFAIISVASGILLLLNVTWMIRHLTTEGLKGSLRAGNFFFLFVLAFLLSLFDSGLW